TVGVAGAVQRAVRGHLQCTVARISDHAGAGLHGVLRHHDIPVPALPVSALVIAAADGLQCLSVRTVARRGGVRAADMDGMAKQRQGFGPTGGEFLYVLCALGRRSADADISAGRTDNGRIVLVARHAAAPPVNGRAAIALSATL